MTDINEFILNKLDKMDEKLDDLKEAQVGTKMALESHEKRDEEIHEDVKAMGHQMTKQSNLLDEYNKSLQEHMRRTDLLEEMVKPMHQEWTDRKVVEKHKMKTWKKVIAIIGAAATLVGLLAGIAQLAGLL